MSAKYTTAHACSVVCYIVDVYKYFVGEGVHQSEYIHVFAITFLICLLFSHIQVATALNYLHDQNIIYRDLKGDNVLVWSLASPSYPATSPQDFSDVINVRVSDYGISRVATPGGLKGQEGTPGYLAPEAISKNGALCAYDNKVWLRN